MPIATMAPPTPPETDGQELQDGFHQLVQHNARSQPQPESYPFDNGSYIPGPPAPFTTPESEPGAWYMDHLGNRSYLLHGQGNRGGEMAFVSCVPRLGR